MLARLFGGAVALGSALALCWLVIALYAAGQTAWALAALLLGGAALVVYATATSRAWRYLFPGVAAMLVFVALPLAYTVQIGFTNYSSSNLLGQERARAYLLDQHEVDETRALPYSLHPSGTGYTLVLTAPTGERYASPVLALDDGPASALALSPDAAPARAIDLARLDAASTLAPALSLRDVITHREALARLRLQLPAPAGVPMASALAYAGLREFAPYTPLWRAGEGGALVEVASGAVYQPNAATGYFENASAERLQPGFKVFVGARNFLRLLGDPDLRGPFVSIFVWTVVFAGLTVLFSTAIGMTLAVVLEWEGLRYRTLYRTLLFLPYAVPGFISILVFKGLFNQNFGEINAILNAAFGVKPAWFADPLLAKTMILIVNTWLGYPYIMVLCSGLIKAIPADLYEASAIAGAGPLTNFRRITAPLVIKPLTPLLISAFAFNFNNFVLISLLTDGRPDFLNTKIPAGTTDILVSYTYRIAFTDAGTNFGLAAAISTVIFALVAVLSLLNLKVTQRQGAGR